MATGLDRDALETLRAAGVASPEHDLRRLAEHAAAKGRPLEELVRRRAGREPLQHILGVAWFRHLELLVGPGVFVPRPETEVVVDGVLEALRGQPAPLVVDLCAGSGAIGLAVATEHPGAVVHLVEADAAAAQWLRRNLERVQRDVERPLPVTVHEADLAAAPTGLDGRVDLVVSNPPYVEDEHRRHVEPEVREHDPALALWGGADGLDVVRRVVQRARQLLRPGGVLVVEHSDRQGESVPALLRDAEFTDVRDHDDLTRRPRWSTGRLRAEEG